MQKKLVFLGILILMDTNFKENLSEIFIIDFGTILEKKRIFHKIVETAKFHKSWCSFHNFQGKQLSKSYQNPSNNIPVRFIGPRLKTKGTYKISPIRPFVHHRLSNTALRIFPKLGMKLGTNNGSITTEPLFP